MSTVADCYFTKFGVILNRNTDTIVSMTKLTTLTTTTTKQKKLPSVKKPQQMQVWILELIYAPARFLVYVLLNDIRNMVGFKSTVPVVAFHKKHDHNAIQPYRSNILKC